MDTDDQDFGMASPSVAVEEAADAQSAARRLRAPRVIRVREPLSGDEPGSAVHNTHACMTDIIQGLHNYRLNTVCCAQVSNAMRCIHKNVFKLVYMHKIVRAL